MADNKLDNVKILVRGNQYSVSQLGIDLVQQSHPSIGDDPIVEAIVVSRRKSGLIETETSLIHNDTMAKLSEHLVIRSTYESAICNAEIAFDEDEDDD